MTYFIKKYRNLLFEQVQLFNKFFYVLYYIKSSQHKQFIK